MNPKGLFLASAAVVAAVAVGYVAWRRRMRELPEAIESGEFERADALAGELLEVGRLGRVVAVPAAVLAACLIGLILLSRAEAGREIVAEAAPEAFGFGSYL